MIEFTRCRHHVPDVVGLGTCAKGHDLEGLVGPEKLGQALRMPCVAMPRSTPVDCSDCDHSGYAERQAEFIAQMERMGERNECVECGNALVGDCAFSRCPNHPEVFIRRCGSEDVGFE